MRAIALACVLLLSCSSAPRVQLSSPVPTPTPTPPPTPVVSPIFPSYTLKVRVTACSPQDPKDLSYYAKHGYEGGTYGIAAFTQHFPKGTWIRVPGYRGGKWHTVDSKGGGVIRKAALNGYYQIDVKFKTYYSAKQWGSKWMDIEVVFEEDLKEYNEQMRTSNAVL